MKFDRHFASYQEDEDESTDDFDNEEQRPIALKIRKGGRAGKSKCYRFCSHPALVSTVLTLIHLVLLVPAILSLSMTRYSFEVVHWVRNHFVASVTLVAGIYFVLLIIFSFYDLYLRQNPNAAYDASASITRVYGLRGVHPRILLTIFLCIEAGLLLTPILVNWLIQNNFGNHTPPGVLKKLPTIGFNPGSYMIPGEFVPYGIGVYSGKSREWSDKLQMDVYLPYTNATKPAIIFYIHGGGFRLGDKSQTELIIDFWLKKGFAFISPQYSLLSHGYNVWDMLSDVKAAYQFVHDTEEISSAVNTSAWFFVGEDAGGYLAAATAYDLDDKNILGVIDFFGLTEWDYYLNKKKYTPMSQILTNLLDNNKTMAAEASASNFLGTQPPATLIVHGGADSIVPLDVSTAFDQKLKAAAPMKHLLLNFEAYDHGLVGSFYSHATQLCYYAMEYYFAALMAQ